MKELLKSVTEKCFSKSAVIGGVTLFSMVPSAFAAEPTPIPATVSGLISANWPDFITLFGNIWNLMVANPYLAFLVTIGIAAAGFRIFRMARKAARR